MSSGNEFYYSIILVAITDSGQVLSPTPSTVTTATVVTAISGSTAPSVIMVGSSVVTASSASQVIVGSQTLRPSGTITLSGSVPHLFGALGGTQTSFSTSMCTATGIRAIKMSEFEVSKCVVSSSTSFGNTGGTGLATASPTLVTTNAAPNLVGSVMNL